ncbi:hypothetical protein [Nocardioides marmoraquaticus]
MVTPVANVSWHLLDRAVIEGRADEPLVRVGDRTWSHARLLEEVAALGGVLRHLGVVEGTPVHLDLGPEHGVEAVAAALATARLGGVVGREGDVVVCSVGSDAVAPGEVPRLVRGDGVVEPDLDWAVMLRAGRTDPAPVAVLTPEAPYAAGVSVGEQVAALEAAPAPHDVDDLRALLGVAPRS